MGRLFIELLNTKGRGELLDILREDDFYQEAVDTSNRWHDDGGADGAEDDSESNESSSDDSQRKQARIELYDHQRTSRADPRVQDSPCRANAIRQVPAASPGSMAIGRPRGIGLCS